MVACLLAHLDALTPAKWMTDQAHSAHVDEARRKAFQSVGRASMFTEQSRVLFFKKKDEEVQKASL